MRLLRSFILIILLAAAAPLLLLAQPVATEPTPEKVRVLMQLLSDPQVQGWIAQQRAGGLASSAPAAVAASEGMLADQIDGIRAHLESVRAAIPMVGGALATALARLRAEMACVRFGCVTTVARSTRFRSANSARCRT